jgi:hypothetical protein
MVGSGSGLACKYYTMVEVNGTLDYYDMATITAVKSFKAKTRGPWIHSYKTFCCKLSRYQLVSLIFYFIYANTSWVYPALPGSLY